MHKLWIVAALGAPLVAQTPQAQPGRNPLGTTRFPAAQNLEWKAKPPAPPAAAPQPQNALNVLQLQIVPAPQICAHVRRVNPSPATDPKMIVGSPKGFESKMPVVKTMPACDAADR